MNDTNRIKQIFRALSDKTRIAILLQLKAEGEQPVGRIVERFSITPPAISRHLAVLHQAGLIDRRVDRQRRMIRLRREAVDAVQAWIASLGHPSA